MLLSYHKLAAIKNQQICWIKKNLISPVLQNVKSLFPNVRVPLGGVPKSGISERGTVRGGTETDLEGYPEALGGVLKTSKMER